MDQPKQICCSAKRFISSFKGPHFGGSETNGYLCNELDPNEIQACWNLLEAERERLIKEVGPDGFNIGVNIGEAAGQTVPHAHFHLIPRFYGDHPSPRVGVRAVIPGKADY